MKAQIFQPGTYFIGDPCYVISNESWPEWCKQLVSNEKLNEPFYEFHGYLIGTGSTCFGDGVYGDDPRSGFYVDSGTLGIVPATLFSSKYSEEKLETLGRILTFDKPFIVIIQDGFFQFDNIEIETDWSIILGDDDEDEENTETPQI